MTTLGLIAIRIRNADAQDPSGEAALQIYPDLLRTYGETAGREMWTQALNELDDANGVERADGDL